MPEPGVTATAARYLAELSYDDLPPAVVQVSKQILLDTLGTAIAASGLGDGREELLALAQSTAGAPESTILGLGRRAPDLTAALVNGGLAHALNYDAVGDAHLGLVPPAPLAAAERLSGVSGRDFIAGVAAGCELSARLGSAIGGGHPTALLGQLLAYFGCAVASARVMRLSPQQMHSALGLALMQAAGTRQVVIEGDPPAKAIYGAFPNHAGLLAAQLAQRGLDARCEALTGVAGVPSLVDEGGRRRFQLDEDFGARFNLLDATFKPWPVSGHVTPYIEAALNLAGEHALRAEDVARVELRAAPAVRAWFEPPEQRKRPQTSAAAANSIYFGVAKALVNGKVGLADFTSGGLTQPAVLQFTERMHHVLDGGRQGSGSIE